MDCYICETQIISYNGHHLIPRESGGEDGPVLDLCSDCHGNVHREIQRLLALYRKGKGGGTIQWKTVRSPNEVTNATHVILTGLKAIIEYEGPKERKVILQLDDTLHAALCNAQRQLGLKRLPDTVKELVVFALKNGFGLNI